jgi:hypothetical protein
VTAYAEVKDKKRFRSLIPVERRVIHIVSTLIIFQIGILVRSKSDRKLVSLTGPADWPQKATAFWCPSSISCAAMFLHPRFIREKSVPAASHLKRNHVMLHKRRTSPNSDLLPFHATFFTVKNDGLTRGSPSPIGLKQMVTCGVRTLR